MQKKSPNRISVTLNILNERLNNKERFSLNLALFICFVFSLLFFNVGINTGGDDAGYVLRAMRLWEKGELTQFQGPVYPIFLAPFYALFKGNLILIRMLSILMFLGSLYFIIRTFRNSIQALPFLILLLTLSVNFYWLTYASLSYSEAMFNVIQFGIIFFFYQRFIQKEAALKDVFFLALLSLLLMKTRAIGASVFVAVFIYFLLQRQWKSLLHFSWMSIALVILWESASYFLLAENGSSVLSQIKGLFRENPYNAAQGSASLKLILERLVYNFNEYISDHTMQFLALRKAGKLDANWIYTIIVSLFAMSAAYLNKSRSKILSFTAIYVFTGMLVVFLTPKMWSQGRFIQPFIPLVYILLITEIQQFAKKRPLMVPTLVITLLLVSQLIHSVPYARDNVKKIEAYLEGDKYYGESPDWKNYFRACEWIGESELEETDRIACRKPQIAALISRKDIFYGIYNIPNYQCSEIRTFLEDTSENFIAIDMLKFFEYPASEQISDVLRKNYSGSLVKNNKTTNISLFNIQDEAIYNMILQVNDKLNFVTPIQTLVSEKNHFSVAFADSLLKILEDRDISYLMLGNLRAIREKRTDEVLSSVHNFKLTIELKYPTLFKEVYKVGSESLEPTTIYKIDYAARNRGEMVSIDEKIVSKEGDLNIMCEWALRNTEEDELILGSAAADSYQGPGKERLLLAKSLPTMNYTQFMKLYQPGNNYLAIDPTKFDATKIDDELASELYKCFYGFLYIGNQVLRLHQVESGNMYRKLLGNSHINQCLLSYEALQHLSDEQKKLVGAIEPDFILSVLKAKNIRYIIEDSLIEDINQNAPRRLVYLVLRKYPDALIKVKESGSSDIDRITLYRINYQVLEH